MNKLVELVKLWFKSIFVRNRAFATYSTKNDKLYLFRNGRYLIRDIDFLIYVCNMEDCDEFSIFLLNFILDLINEAENELKNLKNDSNPKTFS